MQPINLPQSISVKLDTKPQTLVFAVVGVYLASRAGAKQATKGTEHSRPIMSRRIRNGIFRTALQGAVDKVVEDSIGRPHVPPYRRMGTQPIINVYVDKDKASANLDTGMTAYEENDSDEDQD